METIWIMVQAFYGNNVFTEIREEDIDRLILGYPDSKLSVTEKIDRTIVSIPNTDGLVIIYNKYQEEESESMNILATIPEKNLEIRSRCIACRIDDGKFASLNPDDVEIVKRYFVA